MIQLNILSVLLFLLSPFLAIPPVLYGVLRKNKFSVFLLIIIVSFLSYLYVPNYSDDKSRYIEIYYYYKSLDIPNFILYQYARTNDFILQTFVKMAEMVGLKIQWVYFLVTLSFFMVLFSVFQKFVKEYRFKSSEILFAFLLLLTSVSIIDLFSGTRFMFASSMMLYAYYQGFLEHKKWQPILWLLISINIHFGLIPFALFYVLLFFLKNKPMLIKVVFLASFLFLFLPKDFLKQLFDFIGLGGALAQKSDSYVKGDEDFSENYFKAAGSAGWIIYLTQMSWIFLMYFYLLLRIKSKEVFYLLILGSVAMMNIFFPTTTVFLRYALFIKLLFTLFLLGDYKKTSMKKITLLFLVCYIAVWITQFIVMRNNIAESYHADVILLLDILMQAPMNLNQPLR
ncbi:EpsG family protein [Riemerella anatipestifer]|uniref:EpsG family protein n=1 Tax=Riemerella anatipestifer TaxID=34085 RepID=UPI0021B0B563|nr:EpsG family protein [Riemerella anatipestifer]MCT6764019.1 EpsG family protein [Riemerella anatipestifer]MCT6768198.1 EpsG family protein [Riemerella anatipestifer]MCU7592716.1 EpsG family protein [Riemerella anatipestifer]MCU7601015.1 EpsG family protein [Riemerella anatipestifer]MCU7609149.1 EpsG family protein [Riemerella anatipestifer]